MKHLMNEQSGSFLWWCLFISCTAGDIMLFLWEPINNSKNCIHAFWFRQVCDKVAEEILPAFLRDFKRVQQACRPLLRSFSMLACHTVEGVTINVVIQSKSVIIKLNLAFCLILSLVITRWFIVGELKELNNYTFKDSEMMIFIKNWVLNHCFLWDSITSSFQLLHTFLLNLLQLSVNLVCLFDSFIEIVLTRCALLCTLLFFQGGSLKLFQW